MGNKLYYVQASECTICSRASAHCPLYYTINKGTGIVIKSNTSQSEYEYQKIESNDKYVLHTYIYIYN